MLDNVDEVIWQLNEGVAKDKRQIFKLERKLCELFPEYEIDEPIRRKINPLILQDLLL